MKQVVALTAVAAALVLSTHAVAEEKVASEPQTLTGEYVWDQRGKSGALRAEFKATDEAGKFDVSFYFEFRGEDHIYSGSAEGSLSEGKLAGEVKNEDKRRTFTFTGEFDEAGKFSGTHAEIGERGTFDTGTLTLGAGAANES